MLFVSGLQREMYSWHMELRRICASVCVYVENEWQEQKQLKELLLSNNQGLNYFPFF